MPFCVIRRKRTVGRTLMMTTGRVIEALSFYHSLCISLKLDHIKEEARIAEALGAQGLSK